LREVGSRIWESRIFVSCLSIWDYGDRGEVVIF
jgi:hypothetical protein